VAFRGHGCASVGIAMATIIAAMTKATVINNMMRLISATTSSFSVLGNPVMGCVKTDATTVANAC
jgi:hypothetical protein